MYRVPDEFQRELDDVFHGRFRVRWSDKKGEFHLEQKVATGQLLEPPPSLDPESVTQTVQYDTQSDEWIRARDGYFYVMSLRHGDRMPCPVCGYTVKVPIMETREMECFQCRMEGRDGRYRAAYFPLNHIFIEHIRSLDPLTDGPRRAHQRIRAAQIARDEQLKKAELDAADYAVLFNKAQVENNPMVGYGSKTSQPGGDNRYLGEAAAEFRKSQSTR